MLRTAVAVCLCVVALTLPAVAGPAGRVEVVDADTLRVGGETVRLFGIDAPEIGQPCQRGGRSFDCGRWASDAVERAYAGKRAICDDRGRDRYGRQISKCAVGGVDIGETLVASGLAEAFRRYSTDYVDAEKRAIAAGRGIWATEMESPADHRRAAAATRSVGSNGCRIKGNVSSNGRIYHLPGQEHYDRTRISPERGERWFCSEAEARAAGWRRARR